MRRSYRLRQLEETVTIIHDQDGSEETAQMIILEDRDPRIQQEGITTQYRRYVGLLDNPNYSIKFNDKIRRRTASTDNPRGTSDNSQILVVEDTPALWETQRLRLRDTRPIR